MNRFRHHLLVAAVLAAVAIIAALVNTRPVGAQDVGSRLASQTSTSSGDPKAANSDEMTYQPPPGGCALAPQVFVDLYALPYSATNFPNTIVSRGTVVQLMGRAQITTFANDCTPIVSPLQFTWSARFQTPYQQYDASGSLMGAGTLTPTLTATGVGSEGVGTYVVQLTTTNPTRAVTVSVSVLQAGIRWVSIGPNGREPGPYGTVYATQQSGKVAAIAFDPRRNGIVYIGTAAGGVWKSVDRGANWFPVTDNKGLPTLAIGAVAVGPDGTVYAGTGDYMSSSAPWPRWGQGIYKSTDGGQTWQPTAQPAGGFGSWVNRILVDPAGFVYVAALQGVYRSSNGGASWTVIRGNLPASEVYDIALDPSDPNHMYAVNAAGVYATRQARDIPVPSPDPDSAAWNWLTNYFAVCPSGSPARAALAVPADPSQSQIVDAAFACDLGEDRWSIAVYQSRTQGVGSSAWQNVGPAPVGVRASYALSLVMDPAYQLDFFIGNEIVWKRWWPGVYTPWRGTVPAGATPGAVGDNIHADIHALVFDPSMPYRLYAATDGGVHMWDLQNPASASWRIMNGNLAIGQFFGLGFDPDVPGDLIGGLQDNGTLRGGWGGWLPVMLSDGGWAGIDTRVPTVNGTPQPWAFLFRTMYYTYSVAAGKDIVRATLTGGEGPDIGPLDAVWPDPFRAGVMLTRSGTGTTLRGTSGQLYYGQNLDVAGDWTTPQAARWTCIDGAGAGGVTTVAFPRILPSPENSAGVYYVARTSGRVYMIQVAGTGSLPGPSNCANGDAVAQVQQVFDNGSGTALTGLAVDPNQPCVLYASEQNRVFRIAGSPSGGSCRGPWGWANITRGLLPTQVYGQPFDFQGDALAVDPLNSGVIYVGTDAGLFVGQYNGASGAWQWTRSLDFPDTIVTNIKAQVNRNRVLGTLYAATFGRGVYERILVGSGSSGTLSSVPDRATSALIDQRAAADDSGNKHNEISRCQVREHHVPELKWHAINVQVDFAYKGDKGNNVWIRPVITAGGVEVPHFLSEIRALPTGTGTLDLQVLYASADAPPGLETDGIRIEMFDPKKKEAFLSNDWHFRKTWRRDNVRVIEVLAEDFTPNKLHLSHATIPITVTLPNGLSESHTTPFHLFLEPGAAITLNAPAQHDTYHGVYSLHQWALEGQGHVSSSPSLTFPVHDDVTAVVRYAKQP